MARDNAPIGNTCPMIDEVLTEVEYLGGEMKYLPSSRQEDFKDSVDKVNKLMEDIREANSTLRGWGNEQHNEKEDYEREKDAAELTVKELKNDITALNDGIESVTTEKDEALITVEEQRVEIKLLDDFTKELTDERDLALATINDQNDEIMLLNDKINQLQQELVCSQDALRG